MNPKVNSHLVVGSRCSNIFLFAVFGLSIVPVCVHCVYQFTWHGNLIHQSGGGIRYLIRYLIPFTFPLLSKKQKNEEKKTHKNEISQCQPDTIRKGIVLCIVMCLFWFTAPSINSLTFLSTVQYIEFHFGHRWSSCFSLLILLPVLFQEHAQHTDLHEFLQAVHNSRTCCCIFGVHTDYFCQCAFFV